MTASPHLRAATASDAEALAALHTGSGQRTYRGMMSDAFLDGAALDNRRRVWRERLATPDADRLVMVAADGTGLVGFICVFALADPGGGHAPNCRYVWADAGALL